MLSIFFNSLLIGYSGAVMPGSMLTYTIDKSLKNGPKTGIVLSLGHAFFEMFLVAVIFLGAGRFMTGEAFQIVTGLIGGVVLGYLGLSMLKDVWKNKLTLDVSPNGDSRQGSTFLAGILLSVTNPYFLVWWAVVGLTLIMSAYNAFGIIGIVLVYFGHILSDITWFSFVSILVSKTRHLLNLKIYRFITVFLALVLVLFGVKFFAGSVVKLI